MNNSTPTHNILEKLQQYKRKYYLNQLFKGALISLAYLLIAFLGLSLLEYQFRLTTATRTVIFILYTVSALYFIIYYVIVPSYHLIRNGQRLSDKKAAKEIGKYFPEIQDKLLNFIELHDLSSQQNALVQASILQKSQTLKTFNFSDSIKIRKSNRKYFPYVIVPVLLLALILLFAPYMVTEGSYRMIKFNEEFVPEAPFQFHVKQTSMKAYKGEAFTLDLHLIGSQVPSEVYINKEGVVQKLQKVDNSTFEYTFNNPQEDIHFTFEGAGFTSKTHLLKVYERPAIQNMAIELIYPEYTGIKRERVENKGNLIVPEGTVANWWVQSKATDKILFTSEKDSIISNFQKSGENTFHLEKKLISSKEYQLELLNSNAKNIKKPVYSIETIKDKAPDISLEAINDSSLYDKIAIMGEISDDYGFTRFTLFYSILNEGVEKDKGAIAMPLEKDILNQKYFKLWEIDSLLQDQDDLLQYYLTVSDNDAINGAKSTRTALRSFTMPDRKKVAEKIKSSSQSTEKNIAQNLKKAASVNEKLEELDKILKTKRTLSWEDKKLIEEIIKRDEELQNELSKIQQQTEENKQKREKFAKQSPDLQEKAEQLESLMEEMLKDKNDELLEKIKQLMQEDSQSDDFREPLQELKKREKNRLKEMERLMELFKRMEIQYDMNQLGENLEQLAEEQKKAGEQNQKYSQQQQEENIAKDKAEDQIKEQQKLNEDFETLKKDLEEIKERNQSLKQPNPIEDTKQQENAVDQAQQESSEELQKGSEQKAGEKQQKAAEEMKSLAQQISQMQSSMEMEMLQENIDDLRDIVDNLLKLSFRQESLMKDFREVNASDPRFIELSEKQLNMKDDARIVEDSLNSLAERVFQLKTFITKEMTGMNESMQRSLDALQERDKDRATGEQQFAMTSMNNLALMLDDVLEQMQMQMQASMGMSSKPQQGNQQQPGLSEMQKALNQETKELSEGQKSGRQLSEKLGELASEQARLRKMLQEMQKQQSGEEGKGKQGGGLGEAIKEMEKIEEDLVNKRLNSKLIERQEKIVTKLLEAEKAKQEQEEDEERKGETATDYRRKRLPNAFEQYIRQKEKEIERLQNVSPNLTPYYKNEINKYYKRLKSTEID